MTSLRERLLAALFVGAKKSPNLTDRIIDDFIEQQTPLLTAVADVVEAADKMENSRYRGYPTPAEWEALWILNHKALAKLEQILNDAGER